MKKFTKILPLVAAIIALAFLGGCAAVCGVDKPATTPPPPKKWVKPVTPTPTLPTTYTVEKCDDLWSIAAKPQIYNDPWLWPLIYGANGDKIKNPNKIWEGTVLTIPRGVSDADKAAARAKAKKFPKYVPPAGAKRYCPPK
jgi:nucleoid-associated protein YgaU